ncbi:MAG TPA: hypothetical protein VKR30_10555 [Candidatus Limnocylindrales bacterium]|nr:hypothetical protein [Candidatus Limnocylindrales bacterium]
MTTSTLSPGTIDIDIAKADARRLITAIEASLPADERPLRYEDCYLNGLWRRLKERKPRVAASVLGDCEDLLASGHRAPAALQPGERDIWLDDSDPMELMGQLIAARVTLALDGGRLGLEDQAEALAVLDGVIGAVSVGYLHYAGDIVDRLKAHGLGALMMSAPASA